MSLGKAVRPIAFANLLIGLLAWGVIWGVWSATAADAPSGNDLGMREVRGRAYDLSAGPDALIAGATVAYTRDGSPGGVVTTDERGEFSFALPLYDTDRVRITASADGFTSATISLSGGDVVYRFPTVELGLLPAHSGHRISGHLSSDVFCSRDAGGVGINLEPSGRSTLTTADGTFAFEHVSAGDYVLHIESGDFDVPVTVMDEDAVVQFCINCADALDSAPQFGARATGATCRGDCDQKAVVTAGELVRSVSLVLGARAAD